jgi:Tfp pilus assembly protein PilF
MHPELLNNSLFLRYYSQWQKDPDSVVFASVADYFLRYDQIDNAHKVCKAGLEKHPNFTVGHVVMAKIHIARGNFEEADEELRTALNIAPGNGKAHEILANLEAARRGEAPQIHTGERKVSVPGESSMPAEWQTVTMAKIFAGQGHVERAREIYHAILARDPQNEEASRGLAAIG